MSSQAARNWAMLAWRSVSWMAISVLSLALAFGFSRDAFETT